MDEGRGAWGGPLAASEESVAASGESVAAEI